MSECFIQNANDQRRHICDDCGEVFKYEDLTMITDIQERLTPNGVVPSGQCPICGSLAYQLEEGETPDEFCLPKLDINSLAVRRALLAHGNLHGGGALEAAYKMLSEEMGELLVAMNHNRRRRVNKDKVCEEVADVMLLLRLVAHIFISEYMVEDIMDEKAKRFGQRVLGLGASTPQPIERNELAAALRTSFADIIREADDWRPLADHVLAMIKARETF